METDLKMQSEIKTVWICFGMAAYDAALSSLWLQNIYYGVLTIRCFPVKAGALNELFSSKYLFQEPNIDSKFPKLEKGWTFLDFQFYRRFSKISEVYIEDITRGREDMNFIFEWQNNISRTSAASE